MALGQLAIKSILGITFRPEVISIRSAKVTCLKYIRVFIKLTEILYT